MYHKLQSWYTVLKSFAARFWDMEHNRQFFVWSTTDNFLSFRAIFRPFIPLNTWKIKILKKWKKKKNALRYHQFTFVYHKWQSYGVWFLRHGAQQTDCFVILGYFLLFYFTNQKNQNFEKMKTISGDIQIHIIILQLHTTNEDHMIYKMNKKKKNRKKKHLEALQSHDVWFLRYGVQQAEFLVILGHFLPFYPTNNPQNQVFEKIIILHKCTKNLDHIIMFICYTVPEIWCVRCFFFFHFGLFFALLTSKQP